jgi:hypothetical protein
MIEYIPRSGPPEAMILPAVICDTCRRQVAGSGNIVWATKVMHDPSETRQQSPLFAAHKGSCDQALDAWLTEQYRLEDHWILSWEELETFIRHLSANSKKDFSEDPQGEYHRFVIKVPSNDLHREVPNIPASSV